MKYALPIGTTIFVPWANSYTRVEKPCPICFGHKSVTLVLGNGESTPIKCEFCAPGFGEPRGVVDVYEPSSGVSEYVICGAVMVGEGRWEYYHREHSSFKDSEVYTDRAAADTVRERMLVEARAQTQRNFESQFKNAKNKISWTAGYHRAALKDLERKAEWHRNKLKEVTE